MMTAAFHDQRRVCAVIVTYNVGETIHRCVDSIRHQVIHVVVVDNGSDRLTVGELERLGSSGFIEVIRNARNEGVARALNQGAQWAINQGFRWMLTLDHDSEATPGMMGQLVRAYGSLCEQGFGKIGIVGANPFDVNAEVFLTGLRPRGGGPPVEVNHLISSGSLISCDVFSKVGFFDESLFVYYVDDDFCLRLRRAGFRLFLCPEAVLLHSEGAKRKRRFFWRNVLYDAYGNEARYYLTRNAIYMLRKYFGQLSYSYPVVRRLVTDHAKLIFYDRDRSSKMLFSLRGLLDALRGKYGELNSQGRNRSSG